MEVVKDVFLTVMAGGSGTRFWPRSTARRPKQLLPLRGEGTPSLLQETLNRFEGMVPEENQWVLTTESLKSAVSEQLGKLARILAEPQPRNTSPCIYAAALEISRVNPKGVMLVMPSDHFIPNLLAFRNCVSEAIDWARTSGDLVTLGVHPVRPETGYGYLKTTPLKRTSSAGSKSSILKVEKFIEKPDQRSAEMFLNEGGYLWNAGMFVWRVDAILDAFEKYQPADVQAVRNAGGDPWRAFSQLNATSIDYAIMEKAQNVVTVSLDCGWDDVGNWTSFESLREPLGLRKGVNTLKSGELIAIDSSGNIVDGDGKLVALLGLQDCVVVRTGDALLVASKERVQDIRKVVEEVKSLRPDLV